MSEPSRLDRLERDRDVLERAIDSADEAKLPPLVREHRLVLAEIERLAKPKEGSTRDQLAAKREARKAGTKGSASSGVRQ